MDRKEFPTQEWMVSQQIRDYEAKQAEKEARRYSRYFMRSAVKGADASVCRSPRFTKCAGKRGRSVESSDGAATAHQSLRLMKGDGKRCRSDIIVAADDGNHEEEVSDLWPPFHTVFCVLSTSCTVCMRRHVLC